MRMCMCAALMGLCLYKCVCFLCLCAFVWARTRPSSVCLCEYVYTYIHIYTYVYIHVYILTYKYACFWNSFTHLIYTLDTKGNSWYKSHQNGHFGGVLTNMATLWSDKGRVHIWTTFDGRNMPEGIATKLSCNKSARLQIYIWIMRARHWNRSHHVSTDYFTLFDTRKKRVLDSLISLLKKYQTWRGTPQLGPARKQHAVCGRNRQGTRVWMRLNLQRTWIDTIKTKIVLKKTWAQITLYWESANLSEK